MNCVATKMKQVYYRAELEDPWMKRSNLRRKQLPKWKIRRKQMKKCH